MHICVFYICYFMFLCVYVCYVSMLSESVDDFGIVCCSVDDSKDVIWETPAIIPEPPKPKPKKHRPRKWASNNKNKTNNNNNTSAIAATVLESLTKDREQRIMQLMHEKIYIPKGTVTCPQCKSDDIKEDSAGESICRGCGLVLGCIFSEAKPQAHEDDPEDTEGRIHASPDITETNTTVVVTETKIQKDKDGDSTTTTQICRFESTEVVKMGTTIATSGGGRELIAQSARAAATVTRDKAIIRLTTNIKRLWAEVQGVIFAMGPTLSENMKLLERCKWMVDNWMTQREDADRSIRKTLKRAVVIVTRVCAEMGMPIRRADILHTIKNGEAASKPSSLMHDLINTLVLPEIAKTSLIIAYTKRYMSYFEWAPGEERIAMGILSWIIWAFDLLQYIPMPLMTGMPYASADAGVTVLARKSKSTTLSSTSSSSPSPSPSNNKRKRITSGGGYRWILSISDRYIAADPKTSSEEDKLWRTWIKPAALGAVQSEPIPVAKPEDEWPLRSGHPSTIAATIIWLTASFRPPTPHHRRAVAAIITKSSLRGISLTNKTLKKKKKRTNTTNTKTKRPRYNDSEHPGYSEEKTLGGDDDDTNTTTTTTTEPIKHYRISQAKIHAKTYVNVASIKFMKEAFRGICYSLF